MKSFDKNKDGVVTEVNTYSTKLLKLFKCSKFTGYGYVSVLKSFKKFLAIIFFLFLSSKFTFKIKRITSRTNLLYNGLI